jgi:hypothetical protein
MMSRKTNHAVLIPHGPKQLVLKSHAPVLPSERAQDFEALIGTLTDEMRPSNCIEEMYVEDFAHHVWEIVRLRRFKIAIFRGAVRAAIREFLERSKQQDDVIDLSLADKWSCSSKAKDEVRKLLARIGIDESEIEAEAYRSCSRELESLERMLTGLEMRRDNALGRIAAYRQSFARQLHKSADDIIETEVLPPAEDVIVKTTAE